MADGDAPKGKRARGLAETSNHVHRHVLTEAGPDSRCWRRGYRRREIGRRPAACGVEKAR